MQPEFTDGDNAVTREPPDPQAPFGLNPRTGKPYKLPEEERRKRAESLIAARAASNETFRRRREAVENGTVVEEIAPAAGPAVALETRTPIERGEDRTPGSGPRRKTRRASAPAAEPADVPAFRAGPIATGMNRLYVRAGKILRALDWDIGTAVIAMTRKESEDDVSIGEAWEEFARVYPKHRVWILKLIQGGAAGQLLMAHAPLFLAIIMKDSIRRHLPLARLWSAWLDGEEAQVPTESGSGPGMADLSSMFAGMSAQDMGDAYQFAQGLMAGSIPRIVDMTGGRTPTVEDDKAA